MPLRLGIRREANPHGLSAAINAGTRDAPRVAGFITGLATFDACWTRSGNHPSISPSAKGQPFAAGAEAIAKVAEERLADLEDRHTANGWQKQARLRGAS
jgi:hypothetical protein